jgi:transposase
MDLDFGRRLPARFDGLGVRDLGHEGVTWMGRGGDPLARFARMTAELLRARFVAAGVLTEADFDELHRAYDDRSFWFVGFTLVGAWGRRPGDVVIWDNLKPHESEEAIEAVEAAGAEVEVVPLPPWSPDLTPIEEMVSKVKGSLRSAAARTKETVDAAFGSALHDVTLGEIAGWFQDRAAYAMQL